MLKQMNSDTANKTIKNLQAEVDMILSAETRDRTYTYGVSETPCPPAYSFTDTQAKLDVLRKKMAVLRHAINKFNITTKLPGCGDMTVDEGLGRMSLLHREKQRLYEMLQIPEQTRTRGYGSREADFVHRNFEIDEVQAEYDKVCDELMALQQSVNIANLTMTFEVDI